MLATEIQEYATNCNCPCELLDRARQLCPGRLDVDPLCNLNRIIDFDAEVANRTLDFCLPAPESLEGRRGDAGVSRRMLWISMAQIVLDQP